MKQIQSKEEVLKITKLVRNSFLSGADFAIDAIDNQYDMKQYKEKMEAEMASLIKQYYV